jgi:hypothetical protein
MAAINLSLRNSHRSVGFPTDKPILNQHIRAKKSKVWGAITASNTAKHSPKGGRWHCCVCGVRHERQKTEAAAEQAPANQPT